MTNSFHSKKTIKVGGKDYVIYHLGALKKAGLPDPSKLPFSIRILLENLLRHEDGVKVTKEDVTALANWGNRRQVQEPVSGHSGEIAFTPARVILQDFTGVPAIVDLAAMRDQIAKMGGNPHQINPLEQVDLVIDHSVQVDYFGQADAFKKNVEIEMARNRERYQFLKWGQSAFKNFRVVPPGTGIVHQVNLEYLGQVVFSKETNGERLVYPDSLVGTDSHTTMINGLGILGWGVGGIEAEAAMLGQPISMLIPEVIGFKLTGTLTEGVTATDLVLTVVEILRKKGVVGKFVEFFGSGLDNLPLADRATIANMAPEYGATMGFFPVDEKTLDYLRLTGRPDELIELVKNYLTEQNLFRTSQTRDPEFSDVVELDLGKVVPSLAGPKRPQDRVNLPDMKKAFRKVLPEMIQNVGATRRVTPTVTIGEETFEVQHGSVVVAAITSCTNTSNPAVMVGAGLLAKKAVEKGMTIKPWVKPSLAPGSKVVINYLKATGLLGYLEKLKFNLVGYGCTTCIGNSGPLLKEVSAAVKDHDLVAASVLSGNRNFEGRINPLVRANYLASPPLVVAYALAGTVDTDLSKEPLGKDKNGQDVFLKDLWPSPQEVQQAVGKVQTKMFDSEYGNVFEGDENWKAIQIPTGATFEWDEQSTYIKNPPYFNAMKKNPEPVKDIKDARVLVMVGDSVTTDHISPAGSIPQDGPAGKYLMDQGVAPKDFNSFGSRRGNHEVMMRGTFGNIRLRNLLAPGTEGGWTRYFGKCHSRESGNLESGSPTRLAGRQAKDFGDDKAQVISIYEAAMAYQKEGVPLIVIAGKEYGAGSSRDWAAKGPSLLGVRAVIAESYERIHRSNLIGMGILPLQFETGQNRESLRLTGEELFSVEGIANGLAPATKLSCKADEKSFSVLCRIDTPVELEYYQHGGILQYVLRQLMK